MGSPSLTRAPPAQGFAPESKRLGNAVRYCGTQIQLDALLATKRRMATADIHNSATAHGASGADTAEAAIRTPALQRYIKIDVRMMTAGVHRVAVARRLSPRSLSPKRQEGVAPHGRLADRYLDG
jgi:hypothetical protein